MLKKEERWVIQEGHLQESGADDNVVSSYIGPPLWSTKRTSFYSTAAITPTVLPQADSAESACFSSRRRVNQMTSSGRISASVLYQELNKLIVDPHRLVAPYDYGEVHGPAEHIKQPFRIEVHPQVGFLCDVHGHLCDAEVIGLLAGKWDPTEQCLYIQAPFPCAATERHEDHGLTDVELDAEAEWKVRESIDAMGLHVIGWYHSHPKFKPDPSVMDIYNQQQYQQFTRDDVSGAPFVGLIVSTFDTHLATAASHHQWFTVVPYSPAVRSNSIVEDDLAATMENTIQLDRKPAGGRAEQGTVHMPVRMEVSYSTVLLESLLPHSLRSAACSGLVEENTAYSEPLLQALLNLHVGPKAEEPAVEEEKVEIAEPDSKKRGPKSKAVASTAAIEDKPAKIKATKPTTKAATSGKAKATAAPPLIMKKGKGSAAKSTIPPASASDGESVVANSLAGSCDGESTPVPPVELNQQATVDEAGPNSVSEFYDRAYERESHDLTSAANFVSNLVISLDKSLPKIAADSDETMLPAAVGTSVSEVPKVVDNVVAAAPVAPSIPLVPVPLLSDEDLARQMSAEDEATQQGRRPSRGVKNREKYGDFVDTLTALTGLRKQNMEKVKEKELKEKMAAKKAKTGMDKTTLLVAASPGAKGTVALSASKNSKLPADVNENEAKSTKAATGKGKGKRPKCNDCVPPLPTDATLCTEIFTAAKGSKARVKVEGKKRPRSVAGSDSEVKSSAAESSAAEASHSPSVFTSLILALQDTTRPCAALARSLLCTVVPPYRGLMVVVITMGFYYSRAPRRVDLNKEWRGQDKVTLSKIDKLKASAQVWLERLGIRRDSRSGEGGTDKLIELMGQFICACWEDYSNKASRKRKIA